MKKEMIIANLIFDEYKNKKGIFRNINNLLEYQCPNTVKFASREHANFYFYLIYNDHGTKSINLYERFKNLYDTVPYIFNANYVINNFNEESLYQEYLSNLGLRYPKEAAKSWIKNSYMLVKDYNAQAINLYNSTNNAVELFNKIKKFRGYGHKTSGLLLRVIYGVGFNKNLYNFENVPLPVDIHDSRIAVMCNLYDKINLNNLTSTHIKEISMMWQRISNELNIKWEELDRALWLLGSIGCANNRCLECPIKKYCEKGMVEKNIFDYSSL